MSKLDVTPEAREKRIADLNAQYESQQKLIETSRIFYNFSKAEFDRAADELASLEHYKEAIRQDLISWQGE
jgi:flagellar biosynthesis chaperone FliJ